MHTWLTLTIRMMNIINRRSQKSLRPGVKGRRDSRSLVKPGMFHKDAHRLSRMGKRVLQLSGNLIVSHLQYYHVGKYPQYVVHSVPLLLKGSPQAEGMQENSRFQKSSWDDSNKCSLRIWADKKDLKIKSAACSDNWGFEVSLI